MDLLFLFYQNIQNYTYLLNSRAPGLLVLYLWSQTRSCFVAVLMLLYHHSYYHPVAISLFPPVLPPPLSTPLQSIRHSRHRHPLKRRVASELGPQEHRHFGKVVVPMSGALVTLELTG